MFPYNLTKNPFPSGPTPNLEDAHILGGKRHKEARNSIFSCIEDLVKYSGTNDNNDKFRIITVIQDVGSGKTHLTLNIKISGINEKAIISYNDMAQIYPKKIFSIYQSMINGFPSDYLYNLKKELLYYIRDRSRTENKIAKKIFKLGFFESLTGKGIDNKILQILEDKIEPDLGHIDYIFADNFSKTDISIIKTIIQNRFEKSKTLTLIDMINFLSTLSKINLKLLNKISLYQFDEFDNHEETLSFMKAIINAHIPNTILMLILTPSSYLKMASENSSVYDRLEKANYKIDLAGSNSFEEISDIVLEYIRAYKPNASFSDFQRNDLLSQIKILYEDFELRNIRSILNIMYSAFEIASNKKMSIINEQILDETLRKIYPGLKIKGSIVDISISDYIKIKNRIDFTKDIKGEIVNSLRGLINYLHQQNIKCKYEYYLPLEEIVNVVYKDYTGSTSQITMLINETTSSHMKSTVLNNTKKTGQDFKYPNVTTRDDKTMSINLDRSKIIDLLFVCDKIHKNLHSIDDKNKILLLAKSINLC
ncbi:MAG TPA: hypothetical protein VFC05_04885 [Nitrososphaeraceae archaeon]|nr:hypothetical protein [Nitrososphaeraceae archaeon]